MILIYMFMLIYINKKILSKRVITFSSTINLSKPIQTPSFASWFRRPATPLEILQLNPGIQTITLQKSINNIDTFTAYLTPMQFPGVTVQSVVDFYTSFGNDSFTVSCDSNSTKQVFMGSNLLASIISRLTPNIRSESVIKYIEDEKMLLNNASLVIEFPIPSWFPFNADVIEKEGSKAIGSTLTKDLDQLLDKIAAVPFEKMI